MQCCWWCRRSTAFRSVPKLTWQYADERNLAKIVFVNKMERENANYRERG